MSHPRNHLLPLGTPCAVLIPLLLVLPGFLHGQTGAVDGYVRTAPRGRVVSGAIVRAVGTPLGAVTDSAGYFFISSLPVGPNEIEAWQEGKASVRAVVSVLVGDTTRIELILTDAPAVLAGVTIIGARPDALSRIPGSASIVTAEELRSKQALSANEILRALPGVRVQEEEGAGLRANIGIRGLDPDRSRTVLVLEDGVPVALAPYGEPEMYYSPPIDRMERIEVIKGSGSIAFGPQTIGGVINYVTADAPSAPVGRVQVQGGTGASRLVKLGYGGTWGGGRTRGSATAFQKKSDNLDGLFFDVRDVTAKFGLRGGAGDFGIKASAYDESSNSTYVGLTDSIFRATPDIHPQPGDRLAITRYAVTGTHGISLPIAEVASLQTTIYAYRTTRNWNRRDYTYTSNGNDYLFRTTTGSRNRHFEVIGVEPRLSLSWTARGVRSDLDFGVRAHYERARDKHLDGVVDSTRFDVRDDEIRIGRAVAAFIQNRFFLSPTFHVTPGLRVERFEFDRHILRTRVRRTDGTNVTRLPEDVDLRSGDAMSELIPGIGTAWTPTAAVSLFAGAHRGFSPPRTKDALIYENPTLAPGQQVPAPVSLSLDAERSWNYELGTRLSPSHYLTLEATVFHLDFANQIIEPSLSSGSVAQAQLANQGQTRHTGLELGAGLDFGKLFRRSYSLMFSANYTHAEAVFADERFLATGHGDTVNVEGKRLPYAPRNSANVSLVLDHPAGARVRLDGTFVGAQFSDNFETVAPSPNGRLGLIPRFAIVDFAAEYRIPRLPSLSVLTSVKNVFDRNYIASRRPEGIKPGLSRLVTAGLTWSF